MSAADGFLTAGGPHGELERRYRRLLRLYPREFRARRADEMIGVLMAGAADGQDRPDRGDVSDIVRGSLRERLRGPRGGWSFALSAFALVAPLFLVLTDILSSTLAPGPVGGPQLPSQPSFLILVAGHLIVAAAVLAGLRRTALAALVIAAAADYTQWTAFHVLQPGVGTLAFETIAVFLLEAIALASVDPRAARRAEGWQHLFPALALGLGWRASLLLAAACYPLVILAAAAFGPSFGRLPQNLGLGPVSAPVAHTVIVTILYLPPLLVLGRAVTQTVRARSPRDRGDLAA